MVSKITTVAILGLRGKLVDVEVSITPGLAKFEIVGMANKEVREAKERVYAAIKNSGFKMPMAKIIVNLSPADLPKNGTAYDLPIAVGILKASKQCNLDLEKAIVWGELSLVGKTAFTSGALIVGEALNQYKIITAYIPLINAQEAGIIAEKSRVYAVKSLTQLVNNHAGINEKNQAQIPKIADKNKQLEYDFKQIRGQARLKRALEISAVGNHHILIWGSPGSGKTHLAKALAGIMPETSLSEQLEISKIYSVAGLLKNGGLYTQRPFREPHHSVSLAGLLGGTSQFRPGEVSLAHKGILFLDELNLFSNNSLEALRLPLQAKQVILNKAVYSLEYPADFLLVGALNPCKCGYYGDPRRECKCTAAEISRYRNKLSGPLLDRFDIQIAVSSLESNEISSNNNAESSEVVKNRVVKARERLLEAKTEEYVLDERLKQVLAAAYDKFGLTMRSYQKLLKVSRTIAALAGTNQITKEHIFEALSYRQQLN